MQDISDYNLEPHGVNHPETCGCLTCHDESHSLHFWDVNPPCDYCKEAWAEWTEEWEDSTGPTICPNHYCHYCRTKLNEKGEL